jgi:serine/threonine protein kinase
MTPERWQQVKDIFDRAVECDAASRTAYVREHCAEDEELRREVESLLASDTETGSLLNAPPIALGMAVDPQRQAGARIGPYEILRELGKGGMGCVYLARRADGVYPKLVALKVMRSDFQSRDLLHRFEQERRILAALDHPNIARLFDGGKTLDGLPYYVMEFIEGQPINRHCDLQHLDLKARLALFRQVCAAVDCAHRSGIVHRDLKPSNILVNGEGIVKLLDFGIAKLLHADSGGATIWLTDAGLRPMTPEYASPEQIKEEQLTRATDVYSLGVVLYEILTGRRPYRLRSRVFHEILRVVCEEEPTLPSAVVELTPDAPDIGPQTDSDAIGRLRQTTPGDLRRELSGDLDSIVMKALRKEPWQRYESAAQFGEDIRRHLEGSPVEARSGRYYRLGKRLNQNRAWLVLALFLLVAVITGGIHVTWPTGWMGAAALGMFAFWHTGANHQLARRVAGGPIWPALNAIVIAGFFVSVIGLDFLFGLIAGVEGAPPREFNSDQYWALKLFWCVPLGLLWARWAVRSRWAGSPVLDASSGRNRWFGALAIVSAAYIPANLWWSVAKGTLPRNPAEGLFFDIIDTLLWVFLYVLSGRLEFRQYGIVTAGGFYRWPKIESYGWSEDSVGRTVLTLELRGRRNFFPTPKIKTPQAKKPEVEAVMRRFLSEWPDGAGK